MTTLSSIDLTCPLCEEKFSSQAVVMTNSFGGKRTDFHERAAGHQPLPYLLHACPNCGYTGEKQDFEDKVDVSGWVGVLAKELTVPRSGSEKYENAAHLAIWRGESLKRVADLWLRAAWCCVDEGDTEAERFYRMKAAEAFEEALLAQFDGVPEAERAQYTYLVGELYRRSGHVEKAATWFYAVPQEIVDPVAQKWVIDVALQQAVAPREWFN